MHAITIEPGRIERQYWRDIWRYRELFYFLAWRDILIRYKQTVVGIAWSLIRPLLTMIVLTVVFGKLAKLPSGGVPYPILVFCGMLPWQFFASAFSESGNSLVGNANLISKVYFPRLHRSGQQRDHEPRRFPDLCELSSGSDDLVHYLPSLNCLFVPLFTALAFAAAFGAGVWISALMVRYRDFRFIVPFIVQFGLYITPVGFSSSIVPEKWRLLYSLNPMVGVIDGFRWAILGGEHTMYWPGFALSVAVVALLIVSGIWYFRKTERIFSDVI